MRIVSVGVPVVMGPPGGWNFWPLLSVPLALLIAFRWLAFPLRFWIALVAALVGLACADAIAAWGVLPVAAGMACLVVYGKVALGRRPRDPPPPV